MASNSLLPATIGTDRLELRAYRHADVAEMHAYLQEPELGLFLEGPEALLSVEDVESIVARHIQVDPTERSVWAICADDLLAGAVSINFSKGQQIAELGYHIRKSLWGRGYATEAVRAVITTAFERCPDLRRIQAGIHPKNEGSIRVVKKAGMEYEGTLRSYAMIRGQAADEAIYAVVSA